jgi:hypothetical protein
MKCRDVEEILERMVFEEVRVGAGLKEHIASCPACSQAFMDALKAREVMGVIRRSVPELTDPDEITDSIMSSIQQEPREKTFFPLVLQRMLAAASVALLLLFGYEQYGVVNKVTALENKFSETRMETRYSNPQRLASAIDINRAGISLSEIERFISPKNRARLLSLTSFKSNDQRSIK